MAEQPQIITIGPLGPYENNAYLIVDDGQALVVDAPEGAEEIIRAARGFSVVGIVLTHSHFDHLPGLAVLRESFHAPVFCHPLDHVPAVEPYAPVDEGTNVTVGKLQVAVLHTPGHTPGSICLLAGEHVISGDTLFPGGPGHTTSPQALQQEIESIVDRLLPLPDGTVVHPGHGGSTMIGRARSEFALFASRSHPPDLCGDVTWSG